MAATPPMLFADGLVERKDQSIDDGIVRAAHILAETMPFPLDAAAEAALRSAAPPRGYDDDVAMAIYRHEQAPFQTESDSVAKRSATTRNRFVE